jgi:hypothetical protein
MPAGANRQLKRGQPLYGTAVTDATAIEDAVNALAPDELANLRRGFAESDSDGWDCRIETDAAAGRLDHLLHEAEGDCKRGGCREPRGTGSDVGP